MDPLTLWDVCLTHEDLKGRTFLLGNKRAFSLSLPAAAGSTSTLLHAHKWFGAYLYGRKFLEGQMVWGRGHHTHPLSGRRQTGFTMGLTTATRDYLIEGCPCSEEFFLPDGIQGFAATYTGDVEFVVEPQFDMRFYRALNQTVDAYEVELTERGAIVSNLLPSGHYDDASETFLPDDAAEPLRIYAAVEAVGDGTRSEMLPPSRRSRRKVFRKDQRRHQSIDHTAPVDARHDHAPLWKESESRVYAPVRLHLRGHGTVVYGFGSTREEALEQLAALRDNLIGFRVQKWERMREIVQHAPFESGFHRVDSAYVQVLSRLMDALVARHATAEDTALDRPATMILAGNQYFHDSWKRDENIALGFLLSLGFYDLARDVIRDTWQLQDPVTGRLPQRIRAGEAPPYHSSDGTLWALLRLYQYWRSTGDEALLYDKLSMVELFFQRSAERSVDGLLPSGRTTAPDYLWETWMDTPHTPRDGFPIEIQMLWIACLRAFRPLILSRNPELGMRMDTVESAAWRTLQRYQVRGVLADSLDERGEVRDLITPNAYFCFGLGLDLGPEIERTMRDVGRRQLAGHQGIITLAPQDWERVFSPEFLGDRRLVRGHRMRSVGKYNYHRGVEWNWLSQFFVHAELKYGEADVAYRKYLRSQVDAVLGKGGIGGISELYDLSGTRGPEFQAWSMSGFLESLHAFAGVRVDVPERSITIEPQLPAGWPQINLRKWYGSVPFDLRYGRDDRSLMLRVDFPWGEVPECEIEVSLVLPARRAASVPDVRVAGVSQVPRWKQEPIPGSDRTRVRLTLPAAAGVEIVLGLRRGVHRMAASA